MPTRKYDYDLITIGAGSAGVRASRLAGGYGARVAVCEEYRVGGTCVLRGCIPKKLLVLGGHYAEHFADARAYGWSFPGGPPVHDWPALIAAKETELDRLNAVYLRILRDNHVDIVEHRAVLADPHTVEAGGRSLTAETVLIATGGWPAMPAIPGIGHAVTSNEALELPALPSRMVIVGGGYIAVEFAGIFASLGVDVTEVIRADAVLRGFDEDVRLALTEEMTKRGIKIMSETVIRSIERRPDGSFSLRCAGGPGPDEGGEELIETDLVMYATGRAPNTAGIGLEQAGIALDGSGAVIADQWNRTSVPHIYAVGDVTDRMALTPVAIAEGRALAETLYNDNPISVDYDNVPTAVFSTPPVSTVGLTEDQARARYGAVDVYVSRFKPLVHTLSGRDERTLMKLVVDAKSGRVVGAHMMGLDAPEIVQGLAIALKCGATKAQFDATTGIHPSAAEEFVTMRDKRPGPGKAKAAE
jgi:glutathione reductase (NADPH)